jgi:hypothetical protein
VGGSSACQGPHRPCHVCLIRKSQDRCDSNQRRHRVNDLPEGPTGPDLGAKGGRSDSIRPGKPARYCFRGDAVRVGPAIETTVRVAYDLGGQQIRPIVDYRAHLAQLRRQDMNCRLRITLGSASHGICVMHAAGPKATRMPGQREIQDRRSACLEPIEMRIESIVKKHVTGTDAESTPVARLFIPSGEHNGRISPSMGMPALKQPAVAPFVACRDRYEERPFRSVAQWKDSPSFRNVRRSTAFCHESTTPEMPFLYASLMHRNRLRRHLKPIFLHQIGTARCDRYRRSRSTSN